MESPSDNRPVAWLPLTPRGVAAFAYASLGRLWLVQLVCAIITATAVVVAVKACWLPSVAAAIEHLPDQGMIRSGRLEWTNEFAQVLSGNRFIAFSVDPDHTSAARAPAQIQVEFGQTDLRIYSVFGLAQLDYPRGYTVAFNAPELKPWWGAWEPFVLALIAAGVVVALFVVWTVLATVYCLAAWLTGLFLNRDLTFRGSWFIAGAALVPGALVMAAAIAAYRFARLDLLHLTVTWLFHLILGWVYLFLGAASAPKLTSPLEPEGNPFVPGATSPAAVPAVEAKRDRPNPFRPDRD